MPAQPYASSSEPTTREPRLALRLLRIGILVDAGQLLAAVEHRGLRQAERLRGLHQVPRHRLFVVVLDRDRRASAASRTRRASGARREQRVVVEEVHGVTPCRLLREDAAEPLVAVQRLERARVAHQLLDGIVVDEAVAAEDLDGIDRRARDDVAGEHARAAREVGGARRGRVSSAHAAYSASRRAAIAPVSRVVAQPDQRLERADRLAELDALPRVAPRRTPSRRSRRRRRAPRARRAPRRAPRRSRGRPPRRARARSLRGRGARRAARCAHCAARQPDGVIGVARHAVGRRRGTARPCAATSTWLAARERRAPGRACR